VEANTLALAWQAWQEGRLRHARKLAEQASREVAQASPRAHTLLARIFLDSQLPTLAHMHLNAGIANQTDQLLQAQMCWELGQFEAGLQVLSTFPNPNLSEFRVLKFLLSEGLNPSETHFQELLSSPESPEESRQILSFCHGQSKNPQSLEKWILGLNGAESFQLESHLILAQSYFDQGDIQASRAWFLSAQKFAPQNSRILLGLGLCAQQSGNKNLAESYYQQALQIQPGLISAHFNLGVLYLSQGQWREGFRKLEWRLQKPRLKKLLKPLWQGQNLKERRLLVQAEYGLGDQIQFWRFLSPLCEQVGALILEVPAPLFHLAERLNLPITLFKEGSAPPAYDYAIPLLSLPFRLNLAKDSDMRSLPPWKLPQVSKPSPKRTPKIGLVWQGRIAPAHKSYRQLQAQKAIPRQQIQAWVEDFPAAEYLALQPDLLPEAIPPGIQDAGAQLENFEQTLNLLQDLDALLSIDSAPLHLAGSCQVPARLLLNEPRPWLWPATGAETYWYPQVKLLSPLNPGFNPLAGII